MIEFLKKNYMKMVLAGITLAGFIVFTILLANYNSMNYALARNPILGIEGGADPKNATGVLFSYIAGFVFFLSATAVLILSMFKATKKSSRWATLAMGLVGITLMLLAMLLPLGSNSYALLQEIRRGELDEQIGRSVQHEVVMGAVLASGDSNLIIFAGRPLSEWDDVLKAFEGPPFNLSTSELQALEDGMNQLKLAIGQNVPIAISQAKNTANHEYTRELLLLLSQLIIFGLLPLGFGIKMILEKPSLATISS